MLWLNPLFCCFWGVCEQGHFLVSGLEWVIEWVSDGICYYLIDRIGIASSHAMTDFKIKTAIFNGNYSFIPIQWIRVLGIVSTYQFINRKWLLVISVSSTYLLVSIVTLKFCWWDWDTVIIVPRAVLCCVVCD